MINPAVFERHKLDDCWVLVVFEILDTREALVSSVAIGEKELIEKVKNQYPSDRTIMYPIFSTKDLEDTEK